jgi:hypothetical protein
MYLEGVTAAFLAVLLAAVLLGLEVWVLAVALLAWVLSRPALTGAVFVQAGAALAVSAAAYTAAVILVGRLVRP